MNKPAVSFALTLEVDALDHEGRGVARHDGKVVFIDGALPGERVRVSNLRDKRSFAIAQLDEVLKSRSLRTQPRCKYFGTCGGCSMQHLDVRAQVAVKQRVLEDNLARIGRVTPETILPPIYGPSWGYRYRARLSVRYVEKKGGMLVGFHEKRSSFVADMRSCEVLPPRISALISPLRETLGRLSNRDRIPQVEIAIGDRVDVLVLRVLEPLMAQDEVTLKRFADDHRVCLYLQPGGPTTAHRWYPTDAPELDYRLEEFNVRFPFAPTEFTQVNHAMNCALVHRALMLLDPRPGERILDAFCGLGNFTLPIARRGANVVGVEGSDALVARARENARINRLDDRTKFEVANLFEVSGPQLAAWGTFDKALIDPPRDGAVELVKRLAESPVRRIVYVSCSPATLARDAAVLTQVHDFRLLAAGIANMFPHTSHVESIALFER